MAIKWCLSHIPQIVSLFSSYYNKLGDGEQLISVDQNGNEVQIGHKNREGDVFMEEPEEDWEEPFKKMENLEIEEDDSIGEEEVEQEEIPEEQIDEEVSETEEE